MLNKYQKINAAKNINLLMMVNGITCSILSEELSRSRQGVFTLKNSPNENFVAEVAKFFHTSEEDILQGDLTEKTVRELREGNFDAARMSCGDIYE